MGIASHVPHCTTARRRCGEPVSENILLSLGVREDPVRSASTPQTSSWPSTNMALTAHQCFGFGQRQGDSRWPKCEPGKDQDRPAFFADSSKCMRCSLALLQVGGLGQDIDISCVDWGGLPQEPETDQPPSEPPGNIRPSLSKYQSTPQHHN